MVIVLLTFIAGCTENQSDTEDITENATIIHKTYGAFTLPEMQLQQLTVNNSAVVFMTSDSEGNFMKKYEKPFNETAFRELVMLFEENEFLELNDTYTPQEGQPIVTDVGTLEISLVDEDRTKTVKVDPYYSEYMPEGLQEIDSKLLELRAYTLSMSREEAETIARTWIENAPTYRFDGFDLKLENHEVLETIPEQHSLTYTFTSRHGGYGDRTGQMVTQALTPHTIEVIVSEKNVTSAIIDGEWDEISQQSISEEPGINENNITGANTEGKPVEIKYKITGEKAPWDKWYEEGNIKFIKAPTPSELIIAYYGTMHNIELYEVNEIGDCDLSYPCNESYYVAKVKAPDFEKMKTLGWTDLKEF
ncbi:MAG: hypothetical protein ACPK85_12450 [Methanosarcina sp.]